MRVALFTETFLPKIDGIVTRLCHTIEHLTAHGNEVIAIAPDVDGAPRRFARARVYGMPGIPLPMYPELKLAAPGPAIGRVLRRFRPDIIHVVNPAVLGLGGMYYSDAMKVPLVASYHTHLPKYLQHYGLGFLEGTLWGLLKLGHNRAQLNLCTSTAMQEELSSHGIERVKVWQRGVDTELFHPSAASDEMRDRLSDGQPDRPLLLYVGRLSAEKEVSRIRTILEQMPETRLAIVGDGPDRSVLEEHFDGHDVVFTGYLKGQTLAAAFASADLFVFPSRTETLGLVLLEAMAAGCPAMAARSGGITDIIEEGVNGYLFEPNSEAEFVNVARQMLSDRDRVADIRANARKEAERWGWEAATHQLESFYRGVTERAIAC
ncbi:glycosyltransferase family 1 protein [Synechococcus sp. PCC 7336]|uniref:glycosyltransferase family 4 protein n=1 Tax=Synechococcus sp. PCC 7336 TaxID=195250 RepID=UPI00034B4F82|nr:glycosyltransferase family 1 protein [Synechococcus sp. PCC 7336]